MNCPCRLLLLWHRLALLVELSDKIGKAIRICSNELIFVTKVVVIPKPLLILGVLIPGYVARLCQKTPSLARERAFFRLARTAKQAILFVSSMEPDAVQTENKPLEARSSFLTQPSPMNSQYRFNKSVFTLNIVVGEFSR